MKRQQGKKASEWMSVRGVLVGEWACSNKNCLRQISAAVRPELSQIRTSLSRHTYATLK